jgi:hypothetical protein
VDLDELADALQLIGVPKHLVEIGGIGDDAFFVVQVADDHWEVGWSEQGRQTELYSTPSEEAACFVLLGRVGATWLAAVAGADGTGVPPGVPADHPAVQAIVPHDYDPHAGLGQARWEREYWPGKATDQRGRRRLRWPSHKHSPDGFATPEDRTPIVLEPGTTVDQFGPGFSRLVYPAETRFTQRSLPPDYLHAGYHQYRVALQVPVWAGPTAPAFGQSGGGTQYFMLEAIIDLVHRGFLEEVSL